MYTYKTRIRGQVNKFRVNGVGQRQRYTNRQRWKHSVCVCVSARARQTCGTDKDGRQLRGDHVQSESRAWAGIEGVIDLPTRQGENT